MTHNELILFASSHYLKGQSIDVFLKDLELLKVIKRQLSRFNRDNRINFRLFLNNIIQVANCFRPEIVRHLLFSYIEDRDQQAMIKTCLVYLNIMTVFDLPSIPMDEWTENQLRAII